MKICFLIFVALCLSACGKGFDPVSTSTDTIDNTTNSTPFPTGNNEVESDNNEPETLTSLQGFSQSLHPLLRFRCGNCHATQTPNFAQLNANSAHSIVLNNNLVDFINPASSELSREVRGGHMGVSTAIANEIEQALLVWKDLSDL